MAQNQKATLSDRIDNACRGLVYISETDSEVEPFKGPKADSTGPDDFRQAAEIESDTEIEADDVRQFIERLTRMREWHSTRDEENAKGFEKLFGLLKKNLLDLRLYRVGRVQLVLYVVGIDKKGRMRGIRMRGVET